MGNELIEGLPTGLSISLQIFYIISNFKCAFFVHLLIEYQYIISYILLHSNDIFI